jgi:hypothetical protein
MYGKGSMRVMGRFSKAISVRLAVGLSTVRQEQYSTTPG